MTKPAQITASRSDDSHPDVGTATCGCDIVRAVVRSALATADVVGVAVGQHATAIGAGVQETIRSLDRSFTLRRAMVFETDAAGAPAVAAGMTGRGIRTAIITGAHHQISRAATLSGAPFVASICGSTIEPCRGSLFQFVARNPQHAADLVPLAHRVAELTLRPVAISVESVEGVSTLSVVDLPDPGAVSRFLGFASDEIDSAALEQMQHVGGRRTRVMNFPMDSPRPDVPSIEERILVDVAFVEYAELSGRAMAPVDVSGHHSADVLVIAAGRLYEQLAFEQDQFEHSITLLHPTLLAPLPTEQLVQVIARKRAVVIAAASDDLLSYLHDHLTIAIGRAISNAAASSHATPQFPELPQIAPEKAPALHLCRVEPLSAVDKVREVVGTVMPNAMRATTRVTTNGRTREGGNLRVCYRSEHSHRSAAWLAGHLAVCIGGPVTVVGPQPARTVHLNLYGNSFDQTPDSPVDVFICPGRDFRTLAEDIQLIKDGGIIFIEGNTVDVDETWNTFPPEAREFIRKKDCTFFLFDRASIAGEDGTAEERLDGLFLGGLLQLHTAQEGSVVDSSVVDRILGTVSRNGQVDVADAVRQGMHGLVEVDPADLEVNDVIFSSVDRETLFRLPNAGDAEPRSEEQLLRRHLKFVNTGLRVDRSFEDQGLMPVPLRDYLQTAAASREYPVIISEAPGAVSPVAHIIDRLIESSGFEGDALSELTHLLRKVEAQIGLGAAAEPGAGLSQLWNRAVEKVASSDAGGSGKSHIGEVLASARARVGIDGEVWPVGRAVAVRLARHAAVSTWGAAFGDIRREAERLHIALTDLLRADGSVAGDDIGTPAQESTGKGFEAEVDIDALSRMLKDAGLSEPIPESRRRRMAAVAASLDLIPARLAQSMSSVPVSGASETSDHIVGTVGHLRANQHEVIELAKAIRIARLETTGRYREGMHDQYFARFGLDDLDDRERAAIPPYVLDMGDAAHLDASTMSALLELLRSDLPAKVIVTTSSVGPAGTGDPSTALAAAGGVALGRVAVATNRAFVLQASLSDATTLRDGLTQGMTRSGPALFSLFEGSTRLMPALDSYLAAAVAVESRLFPTFCFEPDLPGGFAKQFRAGTNPDPNCAWPAMTVECAGPDGTADQLDVEFTYGDMLACDLRFGRHFAIVAAEEWHDAMMPLSQFALLPPEEAEGKVPFIWMAGRDRGLFRVMVTADVVSAVRRTLADWRIVQELAGSDSSHVRQQVQEERDKLAALQREQIAQAQRKLDTELDRAKGKLAQDIVANIAAGLLDLNVGADVVPRPAVVAPDVIPPAETVTDETVELEESPAVAEPDHDDEPLTLDEPYIETVRCTTCNECTQLNPRLFAYNANQQAFIKDLSAGSYRDLVLAAEKCPVRIIHPGKPRDLTESDLEELQRRAEPFL